MKPRKLFSSCAVVLVLTMASIFGMESGVAGAYLSTPEISQMDRGLHALNDQPDIVILGTTADRAGLRLIEDPDSYAAGYAWKVADAGILLLEVSLSFIETFSNDNNYTADGNLKSEAIFGLEKEVGEAMVEFFTKLAIPVPGAVLRLPKLVQRSKNLLDWSNVPEFILKTAGGAYDVYVSKDIPDDQKKMAYLGVVAGNLIESKVLKHVPEALKKFNMRLDEDLWDRATSLGRSFKKGTEIIHHELDGREIPLVAFGYPSSAEETQSDQTDLYGNFPQQNKKFPGRGWDWYELEDNQAQLDIASNEPVGPGEIISNSEFTGDLSGWTYENALVQSSLGSIFPSGLSQDNRFAVVHTGGTTVDEGYVQQSVQINKSRVANFNMLYNFVTMEYPVFHSTETFDDYYQITISGPSGELIEKVKARQTQTAFTDVTNVPPGILLGWIGSTTGGQTGWSTLTKSSLNLKNGIYKIRVEVHDVGDKIVDSAILLDRISLR